METFFNIQNFLSLFIAYAYPLIPILVLVILLIRQLFDSSPDVSKENVTGYKAQRVFYNSVSSYGFLGVIFSTIIFIPLVIVNEKHETFIYKVLENNNIDIICIISMTFTAMVFAMVFVLILKEKNYYLVFSLSDVLEQYNFTFWIGLLFVSCIMVSLAVLSLLDGEIASDFDILRFMLLEYFFILNMLSLFFTFRVILLIMFSTANKELVMLDRLYRLFGISNLDTTHMKDNWDDKTAVTINFEYLYNQYLSLCQKIHVEKFENVFYSSWVDKEKDIKRVKESARRRYLGVVLCLAFVWACFNFTIESEMETDVGEFIPVAIFVIDIVIPYMPIKFIQTQMIRLFGDAGGYEFSGAKSRYATETSSNPFGKKYTKYVQSMNSLIAFMSMALRRNASLDNMNSILKDYTGRVIEKYRTRVGLLPFWIMGYMVYGLCNEENNGESTGKYNIDYIQEMYKELNLDKKQARDFRRMVIRQIEYVERKRTLLNEKEKWRYIKWLCGKTN